MAHASDDEQKDRALERLRQLRKKSSHRLLRERHVKRHIQMD